MTPLGSLVEASCHPQHGCWGVWFHHHGLCLCVAHRQVCFIKPYPALCHCRRLLIEDLTYAGENALGPNGEVCRVCGQTKRILKLSPKKLVASTWSLPPLKSAQFGNDFCCRQQKVNNFAAQQAPMP